MKLRTRSGFLPRIGRALGLTLGLAVGLVGHARQAAAQAAGVPTAGRIVYPYVDGATKRSHIYVQLPGEPDARRVYDEPGLVWRTKWSPDGEQIGFANKTVLVMRADGSDVRKIGAQPGLAASDKYAWGPGARQITYYEEEAKWDGDLWVASADGVGDPTRLTREGGIFHDPVWSPTRDHLAYTWRPDALSRGSLFVIDASSGVVTPLMPGMWAGDVSWSPDGRELIFLKSNGAAGSDIFVVEATEGGQPRRITDEPYFKHAPVFLDDGSWIAFSWSGDVHVMRADGTDKQALGVLRGPFLINHFDWYRPFRAVSEAGKLSVPWGKIKRP